MANKEEHALYFVNPATLHVELVHADDIEAKRKEGWKEPTNMKPNGQPYNHEDALEGQDAAAEGNKKIAAAKADKAAKKQKDADAARAAADKVKEDEPVVPDFTVSIVK